MNHTDSERRRGIPELASNVKCLAEGFEEARIEIAQQFEAMGREIISHTQWRENDAKPALERVEAELRDIKVTARAVGSVVVVLTGVICWIFLTTYSQLQETAKLTNENSRIIAVLADRLVLLR